MHTVMPVALARTPREAGLATPLAEAERALVSVDVEILALRRELRRMRDTEPVSAAHAVRRAELASRIRAQLDWLVPLRERLLADVRREEEA